MPPRPLTPTLFPYTTLFRSAAVGIPADVELYRGHRAVGVVRLHIQPVTAGLWGQRNPRRLVRGDGHVRSEEHTSELQSPMYLVCRLLLEKKKLITQIDAHNT